MGLHRFVPNQYLLFPVLQANDVDELGRLVGGLTRGRKDLLLSKTGVGHKWPDDASCTVLVTTLPEPMSLVGGRD